MSSKVKIYKNAARVNPENIEKFIPNYKRLGIEPEIRSGLSTPTITKQTTNRPTASSPPKGVKQPYGNNISSPIGAGKGLIPNVGNSIEHTWAGMDGEMIPQDLDISEEIDPNHPMIDNNEFVAPYEEMPTRRPIEKRSDISNKVLEEMSQGIEESIFNVETFSSIIEKLDEEEYLLILDGEACSSGNMEDVQEQVKSLLFGNHELCTNGGCFAIERILVVKKIGIKVGVFLD